MRKQGNSRRQWAEKLKSGKGAAFSWDAPDMVSKSFKGIILGIDPSLRGSGFSVLRFESRTDAHLLESQTLKLKPSLSMFQCLGEIHQAVVSLLERHDVAHVALEQTIYVQNFQTAQILGAARGAAISAVAIRGLPIFEYPPLRIKQAIVGFGRASKKQVAAQVKGILGLEAPLPFDESDAAAVALCHSMTHT